MVPQSGDPETPREAVGLQPQQRINDTPEPDGIQNPARIRDAITCYAYIYSWAKFWVIREWVSRVFAATIVLFSIVELLGPFAHLIHLPLWANAILILFLLSVAALMIFHHHLIQHSLERQQQLNDILQVLFVETFKGPFEPREGSAGGVQPGWLMQLMGWILAAFISVLQENPKQEGAKQDIWAVVLQMDGTALRSVLTDSSLPYFKGLVLDVNKCAAGYAALNNCIVFVPHVRYAHGIQATEKLTELSGS